MIITGLAIASCIIGIWTLYHARKLDMWTQKAQEQYEEDSLKQPALRMIGPFPPSEPYFDKYWLAFTLRYIIGAFCLCAGCIGLIFALYGIV